MRGLDFTNKRLIYILAEINHDIDLLYVIPCVYTRNLILNHLRDRISQLEAATEAVNQPVQLQTNTLPSKVTAAPAQGTITTVQQMAQGNERVLTLHRYAWNKIFEERIHHRCNLFCFQNPGDGSVHDRYSISVFTA
jgi:hypothetical protein